MMKVQQTLLYKKSRLNQFFRESFLLLLVAAEAGRQGRERREESQNDGGAERHKTTVTARAFGPFCPLRQTSGEHQEQTRESEGRAHYYS